MEILEAVPDRVLAIYAHPDDPQVSCGGTLARWADAGSEVHVLVCAAGDKGTRDRGCDPAALTLQRRQEVRTATSLLGLAGAEVLGYLDGELENGPELRRQLVEAVRRLRPSAIVTPDPSAIFFGQHYYNHRDHRVVGFAALDAVAPAAARPLYFPDAGPAHEVATAYLSGSLEPNVAVDVAGVLARKARAVLAHRSQFDDGADWLEAALRDRAAEAGAQAGLSGAELFRRVHLTT
jgi:LmbE family N-acetylglucosaminyl deacetylase